MSDHDRSTAVNRSGPGAVDFANYWDLNHNIIVCGLHSRSPMQLERAIAYLDRNMNCAVRTPPLPCHSAGAGGASQYQDVCKAETCSGTQFTREYGMVHPRHTSGVAPSECV